MIDRIKTIRAFGKTYTVEHVERSDPNDLTCGTTDNLKQMVKIRQGLGWDQERDTVIHEFLHVIDEHLYTKLKESQVHALAGGLYALLVDNPHLINYIMARPKRVESDAKGTAPKKRVDK